MVNIVIGHVLAHSLVNVDKVVLHHYNSCCGYASAWALYSYNVDKVVFDIAMNHKKP